MSAPERSELVLRIERANSWRIDDETVLVSLSGRWSGPAHESAGDELLVVEVSGRRYRYPARSQGAESPMAVAGPRFWTASFELPAWAEPRSAGQASVWIGSSAIEVPPVGREPEAGREATSAPAPAHALQFAQAPAADSPSWPAPAPVRPRGEPAAEDSRSGPLAELLLRETVSGLRSELRARAIELGQARGALADARARLDAGAASQEQMNATHAELRAELRQLSELVEHEGVRRAELERARDAERVTASRQLEDYERSVGDLEQLVSERDAALELLVSERDAALELLVSERDAAVEQAMSERDAALEQASERDAALQELAMLRASTQHDVEAREDLECRAGQLSDELVQAQAELAAANASRDGALSEATGLRVELDRLGGELAGAREQLGRRGGELGQARALLADARALAARLRERRPDPLDK
jgi:hypothetical protein